jgi:glyoxylase-like metal-dependent hydrolase (beta-lactamase superfamily II)
VLRQVADGVLIHESEFVQSNAVVVQGRAGVLLIDPGVHGGEIAALANDLRELGQPVVAGFSTHPHEGAAGDVDVLVPGHGSIGGADQAHQRIDQDRAYVQALRDADAPGDPRLGPSAYGKDFLPGVHARQLQGLARRSERDGTPG